MRRKRLRVVVEGALLVDEDKLALLSDLAKRLDRPVSTLARLGVDLVLRQQDGLASGSVRGDHVVMNVLIKRSDLEMIRGEAGRFGRSINAVVSDAITAWARREGKI